MRVRVKGVWRDIQEVCVDKDGFKLIAANGDSFFISDKHNGGDENDTFIVVSQTDLFDLIAAINTVIVEPVESVPETKTPRRVTKKNAAMAAEEEAPHENDKAEDE
jgi:hypothetical protein